MLKATHLDFKGRSYGNESSHYFFTGGYVFDINKIVRENIKKVKPYSSARDEFSGEAKVFLDANENSLGSPLMKCLPAGKAGYNRYPGQRSWLC